MLKRKQVTGCFSKAATDTINHDGIEHAGYLAYLGLLSFFPFLVFFVSLAGFLGQKDAGQNFIHILLEYLPAHFIKALLPRIEEIVSGPPAGLFTIAILATIWTASSAVEGARTVLNRAYRVSSPPAYIWRRLMAIVQFLAITLAVFIAMFFLVFAPIVWDKIEQIFHLQDILAPFWTYMRLGLSILLLGLSVATSYYVLPNIKQRWSSVVPGTVMVLIGWLAAAACLSYYLGRFQQLSFVYGSLEGIIVALLFFWATAVVYIFGAEFNYHFERALGHKVVSKDRADGKQFYLAYKGEKKKPSATTPPADTKTKAHKKTQRKKPSGRKRKAKK